MTCPICGEETKVVDSRSEPDCVHRRRVCIKCKYSFTTSEVEDDLLKRLEEFKKKRKKSKTFTKSIYF